MLLQCLPILPIFVTIIVFLLLRRTYIALFAGCVAAALILTSGSPLDALWLVCIKFITANQLDYCVSLSKIVTSNRLPLYLFIIFLNIYISLIHQSGVAYGYYNFLVGRLKTKVGAELSTLFLGFLLFVDDYLNIITNTKVSSMFSGKFKIPKLKICFLAACLAAPLCSLIPISSWGADIMTTISSATSNTSLAEMDAFFILIKSQPFAFFSVLIILAAFIVVTRSYSFGIIRREEILALTMSDDENILPENYSRFKLWHFVLPIVIMVGAILSMMLFFGNFFSGEVCAFDALKNNPYPNASLLLGTVGALLFILPFFLGMKLISTSDVITSGLEGFSESASIILLLSFSTTFARFIDLLGTGQMLCSLAQPFIGASMLPASIFLITTILAFLLGSSWATINIVIPTVLPVVQGVLFLVNTGTLDVQNAMFISIGAVISGAVLGSGLSPISDLLNMATKSCHVSHSSYLTAQFQYSMLVGISTLISYLVSGLLFPWGYGLSWLAGILTGLFTLVGLLRMFSRFASSKE